MTEDDIALVSQHINDAKQAIKQDDYKGAIEHARYAARAVGRLQQKDRNRSQDALPVQTWDNRVRQLFSQIANEAVP